MSRNLLAQHKLDDFATYCESLGCQVDRQPKGVFQKLGVRHGGPWMYVYEQLNKTVHYTVDHRMESIVRMFIRSTRT